MRNPAVAEHVVRSATAGSGVSGGQNSQSSSSVASALPMT